MSKQLRLHPNAILRWSAGRLLIGCPPSDELLATDDPEICAILHAFAQPRSPDDVAIDGMSAEDMSEAIEVLSAMQILQPAAAPALTWEVHDALFHASWRGGMKKLPGAPGLAAVAPPAGGQVVALPLPVAVLEMSLGDALARRRSARGFRAEAMSLAQLSTLFHHSLRNSREFCDDQGSVTQVLRPYPSGGAAHSLEVYVAANHGAVEALPQGLYHYCAHRHELQRLPVGEAEVHSVLRRAQGAMSADALPPLVLVITSRFARVAEGYRGGAYCLVIKEVGCLTQALQLAATGMGVASCPLGIGIDLPTLDSVVEPTVGEIAIGLPHLPE